jgi:hypothetical protein
VFRQQIEPSGSANKERNVASSYTVCMQKMVIFEDLHASRFAIYSPTQNCCLNQVQVAETL